MKTETDSNHSKIQVKIAWPIKYRYWDGNSIKQSIELRVKTNRQMGLVPCMDP